MSLHIWEITIAALLLILAFDFALAYKQRNVETTLTTAVSWTLFYIAGAVVFGISLGQWSDIQAQNEFFAGWLTEYSLSFDNLFVFVLILARLKVARERTNDFANRHCNGAINAWWFHSLGFCNRE